MNLFVRFVTEDGEEIGKIENMPAVPKVGERVQCNFGKGEVVDVLWLLVSTRNNWQEVHVVIA